jgi:hypothetical protein
MPVSQLTPEGEPMKTLWVTIAFLTAAAATRGADAEAVEVSGLKSAVPAGWKKAALGQFQLAAFTVPKADGDKDDTKVLIFYTDEKGMGTVDQNIKRYRGMFKAPAGDDAKVEKTKIGEINVTRINVQGTYLFKARPFDPNAQAEEKPDYRLIAVIADGKKGPFYVRFIGPAKGVEKNKKDFDEWLKNFK